MVVQRVGRGFRCAIKSVSAAISHGLPVGEGRGMVRAMRTLSRDRLPALLAFASLAISWAIFRASSLSGFWDMARRPGCSSNSTKVEIRTSYRSPRSLSSIRRMWVYGLGAGMGIPRS